MRTLISGVGIAGPSLAWWLRHYGHEPVLMEQAHSLRTGGYVIDFWGSGYAVAERMGLQPGLQDEGYVVQRLRSISFGERTTAVMNARIIAELAGGRYLTIPRSQLSKQLFKACSGIECRFGLSLTAIEQHDDRVEVRFSDGSQDSFDLLIGADGLHSVTRALAFGPQSAFEHPLGMYVAAMVLRGYYPRDELTYVQFTQPQRQISRLALHDDRTLILFIFRDALLEGEPSDDFSRKQALRSVFAGSGWESETILSRLDEIDDLYFDRVSQIELPHWSAGRVALVGDAAACPSLLAGEGSGLAMTEAYILAGELHRANGNHRAAFAAYEEKLKDYVVGKQSAARRLTGFFSPKSWFGLVLREAAINLAAIPFLTRFIVGADMAGQIELPSYDGQGVGRKGTESYQVVNAIHQA